MCTLDTSQDLSCDLGTLSHAHTQPTFDGEDGSTSRCMCQERAQHPETLLYHQPPTPTLKGGVEVMLPAWLPDRHPEHFHNRKPQHCYFRTISSAAHISLHNYAFSLCVHVGPARPGKEIFTQQQCEGHFFLFHLDRASKMMNSACAAAVASSLRALAKVRTTCLLVFV